MSVTLKSRRWTLWSVTSLFLLLPVVGHGQRPSHKDNHQKATVPKATVPKATVPKATVPKATVPNAQGRLSAALITVVKSPVFWNPNSANGPANGWRKLVKMKQPQALHAGEIVCCGPGGDAELLLSSGTVTMTSGQVLPIVNVPPAERASLNAALDAFLVTAGNPRGMMPVFFSPLQSDPVSERNVVRPETFTFVWRPLAAGTTLTLTLRQRPAGPTLWQAAGISGEAGRFVSVGAREALANWQNTHDSIGLYLDVLPSSGSPFTIRFSVLSAQRERSLSQALAVWATAPNPLLHHLGRASVFYQAALYPESVAEYEAARKLAPDSPLVRRRTVEAYKMYRAPADVLEPSH